MGPQACQSKQRNVDEGENMFFPSYEKYKKIVDIV